MVINETNELKVLVIAPSWVGDAVMSQSLLKYLKKVHNNSKIDIFAHKHLFGLFQRMPEVNNIIINPFVHGSIDIIRRITIGYELKKNNYDEVYVLPNTYKSALIIFFASIKKRLGFVGEFRYGILNKVFKLNENELPLMVDRFCALANNGKKVLNIEYPSLELNIDNQNKLKNQFNISTNAKLIIMCPSAEYGPSKRWPIEYFAKLANNLVQKGFSVLLLGSNKDDPLVNQILSLIEANSIDKIINACGKTNLADCVDLLSLGSIAITNDTGLMHIASAVNTSVIAIYGSTTPKFTPPLSKKAHILKMDISCSPCFQRTCKFGHYHCLKFVTPEMVYEKINSIIV